MEHTPGNSSVLPFATKEATMLHDLCKSMAFNPIEPGRRKQDIISHLPDCKIFHFAGHGYTDNEDPLKSHLLLGDGKSDPLAVAALLEMNLRERPPFLAYLSACGTGRIRDERFFDESVHLISACQLAGFRHVIGTL
jgi:CHAT domain-containing protein